MSLYFEPVLPDESAETVRSSVLKSEEIKSWVAPKIIPTCISSLEEIDCYDEAEKEYRFLSFISEKCKVKGNDAEKLFIKLCSDRGWKPKVVKNSEEYDYKHHVDAMIKVGDGKEIWVDVKCMRSLRRGWSPQSEYMWVELHSTGWLFGGKATVVAQQITETAFALFDRIALSEYVKDIVDVKSPVVPFAEQSYLRVFLRETKGALRKKVSVLSLVKTEDAFKHAGCGLLGI
jgi:hypothetical protein